MKIRIYQSAKGDCLRITGAGGGNILVDGGMADAFGTHVQPDLGKLAKQGVPLDLVYISHIDQDHIAGVLQLLDDTMAWRVFDFRSKQGGTAKTPQAPRMPEIGEIWHNAFSMQLKENAGAVENLLAQSSKLLSLSSDPDVLGVAAEHHELAFSVGEAIQVSKRIAADQLNIPLNAQFGGQLVMVRSPAGREARVKGMNVFVIGPFKEDVEKLRDDWDKWLRANAKALIRLRAKAADDAQEIGNGTTGLTAVLDISLKELGDRAMVTPPNLASVMLVLEEGSKRVILTGDGHADDILAGLEFQGFLDNSGKVHVDVLKVQHHGSEHNIREDFCRRISADHYIFCGNGMHENPDLDVVELLLDANKTERPTKPYTLWFNCASSQAPAGKPKDHMKKVETLVAKHVKASAGKIKANFLSKSSFDLSV